MFVFYCSGYVNNHYRGSLCVVTFRLQFLTDEKKLLPDNQRVPALKQSLPVLKHTFFLLSIHLHDYE